MITKTATGGPSNYTTPGNVVYDNFTEFDDHFGTSTFHTNIGIDYTSYAFWRKILSKIYKISDKLMFQIPLLFQQLQH